MAAGLDTFVYGMSLWSMRGCCFYRAGTKVVLGIGDLRDNRCRGCKDVEFICASTAVKGVLLLQPNQFILFGYTAFSYAEEIDSGREL